LKHVIIINNSGTIPSELDNFLRFDQLPKGQVDLGSIQKTLDQHDGVNLQFTSGTTGSPKAAMLTHQYPHLTSPTNCSNIINNGLFIGDNMALTNKDRICIPPPLFHCFGLVLGNLAVFTHGATAVYASETFNPGAVLKVVAQEKCTGLHGVPTMFVAELDHEDFGKYDYSSLRYSSRVRCW
jgi:fatty-acyl-CoA synthase